MSSVGLLIETGKKHAWKWIVAGKAKGMCDQEAIETLLRKRSEYLGIKNPRKIVWCASVEELQEKLSKDSLKNLLYDLEKIFIPLTESLEQELYKQLGDFMRVESPSWRLTDLLSNLRVEILEMLEKSKDFKKAKIGVDFKEVLWALYTREGKNMGPITKLKNFWDNLLDPPFCAYLDSLWQCLPRKEKVKNYFAYIGEAREAGLGIYIPSQTTEYLLPIPEKFFAGSAKGHETKQPKIEWPNEKPGAKTAKLDGAEEEVKTILSGLISFAARMRDELDDEEILAEIGQIVELAQKLLPTLKKEFPKIGLTWEVERTVKNYLPEIGYSYLKLSEQNREKKRGEMLEILRQAIRENLEKALENVEENRISEFDIVAEFLRKTLKPNSLEI